MQNIVQHRYICKSIDGAIISLVQYLAPLRHQFNTAVAECIHIQMLSVGLCRGNYLKDQAPLRVLATALLFTLAGASARRRVGADQPSERS
jgi:hypothetical protein